MTPDLEIAVIGAGPAGSAAATVLARSGHEVTVFDRATFPRDKCCGDGLTSLALRELEQLDFDPSTVASWRPVSEVSIRDPHGHESCFSLPKGPGHHAVVARRSELDASLLAQCRSAGAEIREGSRLVGASTDDRSVTLDIDGKGQLTARLAIGADGMWSPLRKSLGLAEAGYHGEWHAFRQYFRNVGPRAARELVVWFERDLLPGYAWSFPLNDGRANVGFGIRRGGRHSVGEMNGLWADLLSRPHIREVLGPDSEPESPYRAWPIPARVGRSPLRGPHTLFAGDAAALCDPMSGEGIGQALLSGRLAAESIHAGGDTAEIGNRYENAIRRELVADDRMARLLVPLLARPVIARGTLRLTGATTWTRQSFARWLFEDYPRALIATPRRWHRGMFSGTGAFG